MKSMLKVIQEQFKYHYLIRRLALYELKSKNKNNYLGMSWELINPSIQILIYWFVFGSIRQREPIEMINGQTVPFILWLIGAFVLWTFFYQSLIQGSRSIYSRLRMLSKMNFPMSVIPSVVITSQLYIHIIMLLITILILNLSGYYITWNYIQLVYYLIGTVILVYGISLITSTLSTLIRDVHMFLNATLRMLMYLSPILWPISTFIDNDMVLSILKLNPFYYLVEGYRAALFGTELHFITHWQYSLYFWLITFLILLIGSKLHLKFRKHFIDYL